MWLWDGATPRRAAVLGFWFNAGTFSVGTYWLYIAIKQIGHAPLVLALFLMVGLVAIMGAYHALAGLAGREVPAAARRDALARGHSRRVAAHRVVAQLVPLRLRLAGARLCAHRQLVRRPRAGRRAIRPRPAHAACWPARWSTLLLGDRRARIASGGLYRRRLGRGVRRCAASSGRSPTAGRSPSRWCRARFRRMRNGSTDNLESILELYRTRTREAHGAASHRLARVRDPRPG